jgi:hypothetical protein
MFYAKYPEGTLHFQYKGVLEFNGETFIYGEAFAYPERDKMAYASGWAMERVYLLKVLGVGLKCMIT